MRQIAFRYHRHNEFLQQVAISEWTTPAKVGKKILNIDKHIMPYINQSGQEELTWLERA